MAKKRKHAAKKSFLFTVIEVGVSFEYELDANDVQLIADALQIVNPDTRIQMNRAKRLVSIFADGSARETREPKTAPVFIEVSGGIVSSVKHCPQKYEVIDWDALFESGDSKREWKKLS